jgi:hypothetical protein
VVVAAMSPYAPAVDDHAARDLISKCRQMASDATAEEIAVFVDRKGRQIARGDIKARSVIGFMHTAVPRCFEGESLRQFRAERRAEVDRTTERQRRETAAAAENEVRYRAILQDPNCRGMGKTGRARLPRDRGLPMLSLG